MFGASPRDRGPLQLGSVKTNIGHLEAAAGVASFIKVVLQHVHRELTPTLHFETPNPLAGWRAFEAQVVTRHGAWAAPDDVASGVSSFGISGTNVHVVVAGAPSGAKGRTEGTGPWVLPISARSDAALRARARALADHLARAAAVDLSAVARTLAIGRTHFARRRAIVASSAEEAVGRLRAIADGEAEIGMAEPLATAYERGGPIDWPAQVPGRGHARRCPRIRSSGMSTGSTAPTRSRRSRTRARQRRARRALPWPSGCARPRRTSGRRWRRGMSSARWAASWGCPRIGRSTRWCRCVMRGSIR